MKVTFCTRLATRCGIADYSLRLLHELSRLVEVEVVEIPVLAGGTPSAGRYLPLLAAFRRLGASLNRGDICHVQHEYAFWGNCRPLTNLFPHFARPIRIPVVMTVHEILDPPYVAADLRDGLLSRTVSPLRPLFHRYQDYVNRGMFLWPSRVVVHTAEQKELLLHRGVPARQVVRIPHAIAALSGGGDGEGVVCRFALEGKRLLTLLGFVSQRKGYDQVLDLLPSLPDDVVFVVAGGARLPEDEAYLDALRARLERESLSERVVITSYLSEEEQKVLLERSLLVVAPFEAVSGSGTVSLALGAGKCVIASDLPPLVELASETQAMLLFRNGDSEDFLRVLLQALDDDGLRTKKEAHARRYAAMMTYARIAEQTVELYREVLAEK